MRVSVVVPTYKRPDLLARAIRDVMADPEAARRRVEAAGTRLGEEFALEPWLDRYQALYHGLLRP